MLSALQNRHKEREKNIICWTFFLGFCDVNLSTQKKKSNKVKKQLIVWKIDIVSHTSIHKLIYGDKEKNKEGKNEKNKSLGNSAKLQVIEMLNKLT